LGNLELPTCSYDFRPSQCVELQHWLIGMTGKDAELGGDHINIAVSFLDGAADG
jgi:hypothetical protein